MLGRLLLDRLRLGPFVKVFVPQQTGQRFNFKVSGFRPGRTGSHLSIFSIAETDNKLSRAFILGAT